MIGIRWGEFAGIPAKRLEVIRRRYRTATQLYGMREKVSLSQAGGVHIKYISLTGVFYFIGQKERVANHRFGLQLKGEGGDVWH